MENGSIGYRENPEAIFRIPGSEGLAREIRRIVGKREQFVAIYRWFWGGDSLLKEMNGHRWGRVIPKNTLWYGHLRVGFLDQL